MSHEKLNAVSRIQRQKYLWCTGNLNDPEQSDRHEPKSHHWSEYSADFCGSFLLHHEQREQNSDGRGNNEKTKCRSDYLETFRCAEHRHCRRDDAVTIQQRCAGQAERSNDETASSVSIASLLLKDQCKKCELTALTAIVRAQNENDVLDADDNDQRPDDERKNSVDVRCVYCESMLFLEAFAECVKWARSDVAVNDTDCQNCELCETSATGIGLGMINDARGSSVVIGKSSW